MNAIKDIELCGFGNGLVDILMNVEESDLISLNIPKGGMILIDTDKRLEVLNYFKDKEMKYMSGGSAANSVIAFAELGGKAAYQTVLGNDDLGNYYANEFKELGIILNADQVDSHPTGTCVIFVAPDSERTLYTHLSATSLFNVNNIHEDIIERSQWIYIEGYKFSEQSSTEAIHKAVELCKKHNTKISVTFSDTFITEIFRDGLMKVVENSDLIFCNETEALNFAKTDSLQVAINYIDSLVPNYAITLGAKGSIIKWDRVTYEIPAYPTKAMDTTGAGDMFAGTFLYSIIKGDSPEKAGNLASLCSSKIVAQMGPRAEFDLKDIYQEISQKF